MAHNFPKQQAEAEIASSMFFRFRREAEAEIASSMFFRFRREAEAASCMAVNY